MQENTTPRKDAENIKEKIRAKYQSAIPDDIDIISATPQENFFEDDNEKRVASAVLIARKREGFNGNYPACNCLQHQ